MFIEDYPYSALNYNYKPIWDFYNPPSDYPNDGKLSFDTPIGGIS